MKKYRIIAQIATLILAFGLVACTARKVYPDPEIGWHSPDYSTLFGRIQRIPGATPDDKVTWTIRFGDGSDNTVGEFALDPPERMAGYSGGERVEIQGRRHNEPTNDSFNGRWYTVDSIRMWEGQR